MDRTCELLERLGALLRSEGRAAGQAEGLQPIHVEVLHYLDRCNRYSDTPAALTEFLGQTKGTVSQTLGLLERKGLVAKAPDADDGRKVRLRLTPAGRRALGRLIPPPALEAALADLDPAQRALLPDALEALLRALQRRRGGRAFGLCRTCRHHRVEAGGRRRCGLTGERLTKGDAERICREHEDAA